MSDERLRELERRWRQSGAAADEVAYLATRARELQERDVPALVRLLGHEDGAIRRAALAALGGLTQAEAEWSVLFEISRGLGRADDAAATVDVLERLGARGIDLKAAVQASVKFLRTGGAPDRSRAVEFLRASVTGLRDPDSGWRRPDLPPYAGTLVEVLIKRDPSPESEVAADLLLLMAETDPSVVSSRLYLRWTDGSGPAFDRLVAQLKAMDPVIVKKATRVQRELSPIPTAEIVAQIEEAPEPLLVTQGQFRSASAGTIRIGVFRAGRLLVDAWVTPATLEELVSALSARGEVRRGRSDVMYATAWGLAWTSDSGPIEVWDREGLLVGQQDESLVTRTGDRCRVADVTRVHGYLSDDWELRGVRCLLGDGENLPVAEVSEPIVRIDPTYDAIDVMGDAGWVGSLARALGEALGVDVVLDDPL